MMVAVCAALLRVAVMVAESLEAIVPAVAVKVAVVELAATVTEEGTVRVPLLEDRDTVAPPVGATLDSVTVQVLLALEARVVGEQSTDERLVGAWRVIVAV